MMYKCISTASYRAVLVLPMHACALMVVFTIITEHCRNDENKDDQSSMECTCERFHGKCKEFENFTFYITATSPGSQ